MRRAAAIMRRGTSRPRLLRIGALSPPPRYRSTDRSDDAPAGFMSMMRRVQPVRAAALRQCVPVHCPGSRTKKRLAAADQEMACYPTQLSVPRAPEVVTAFGHADAVLRADRKILDIYRVGRRRGRRGFAQRSKAILSRPPDAMLAENHPLRGHHPTARRRERSIGDRRAGSGRCSDGQRLFSAVPTMTLREVFGRYAQISTIFYLPQSGRKTTAFG